MGARDSVASLCMGARDSVAPLCMRVRDLVASLCMGVMDLVTSLCMGVNWQHSLLADSDIGEETKALACLSTNT